MRRTLEAVVTLAIFAGIVWILRESLSELDWRQVGETLADTPLLLIVISLVATLTSYAIYTTFDWLGVRAEDPSLPRLEVMAAAFAAYSGNFNFGAWIGAMGLRYKLYTAFGLSVKAIARVAALSTVSNWAGYALVAGLWFLVNPPSLPSAYGLDAVPLRLVAGTALVLLGLVAWLVRFKDEIRMFGWTLSIPNDKEGGVRVGLAVFNWLLVAGLMAYIFHRYEVPVPLTIGTYLMAAVAGLLVHIPAGLGVYEAVFLAMLAPVCGEAAVLSGMVLFRVIYYFFPLLLGAGLGLWSHARAPDPSLGDALSPKG